MTALQRALAIARLFASSDHDHRLIEWIAANGVLGDNPLDDPRFHEIYVDLERPRPSVGFETRLLAICVSLETKSEHFLALVNDVVAMTIDWTHEQGDRTVDPSAQRLIEAYCANGVGTWYQTQEYDTGIMLHLVGTTVALSVREDAVGMTWRDGQWYANA